MLNSGAFFVFDNFLSNFPKYETLSVIHGWKAKDVRIYMVKSRHFSGVPVRVQNFVNTVTVKSSL